MYLFGGSTSCSSHTIFILVPTIFHSSTVHVGTLFIVIRQIQYLFRTFSIKNFAGRKTFIIELVESPY